MRVGRTAVLAVVLHLIAVAGIAVPLQRAFVSALNGSDSNPCTRTAPCRNFSAALLNTAPGGEIIVLDSGGYGTIIDVEQAVTITAPPGVYAGITAFSFAAIQVITVDTIVLRGLTLNSLGGTWGVLFSYGDGASLFLEDVTISNFTQGIRDESGDKPFTMEESNLYVLRLNTRGVASPIVIQTARHNPRNAVITSCTLIGTGVADSVGVSIVGTGHFHISDVLVTDTEHGITVFANGGPPPSLTVDSSQLTHNQTGIRSGSNTMLRLTNTRIIDNSAAGLDIDALAVVESAGNNIIRGNAPNINGSITTTFNPD